MANFTPETAINISSFPFTHVNNLVNIAPDDLVNIPSGATGSHAWNALWYKVTPTDDTDFFFLAGNTADEVDYSPLTTVWVGTPGSLTQYTIVQPGTDSVFSSEVFGGFYFRLTLTTGVTYYIQCIQNDATNHAAVGSVLTLIAQLPSKTNAIVGSIVITDDDAEFPATILDPVTFQFVQYRKELPATEFANTQPTGEICASENATNKTLSFFDGQLNLVNTSTLAEQVSLLLSDRNGNFYIFAQAVGVAKVYKYTAAGIQVYSKSLPSDFQVVPAQGAIELDGSIFYMAKVGSGGGAPTTIYRYNLTTNTQLGNLTVAAGVGNFIAIEDGFVTAAGELVFAKRSSGPAYSTRIYKYNKTTGATILTIAPSKVDFGNHFCYVDDEKLLLWGYEDGSLNDNAFFEYLDLSDGSSLLVSSAIPVTQDSITNTVGGDPNAISNSCPLFVITQALEIEASDFSGLYRMVPGRKKDTYYVSFNPTVEVDHPIVDPHIITSLLGDE